MRGGGREKKREKYIGKESVLTGVTEEKLIMKHKGNVYGLRRFIMIFLRF